jgi:hypothetical protein
MTKIYYHNMINNHTYIEDDKYFSRRNLNRLEKNNNNKKS